MGDGEERSREEEREMKGEGGSNGGGSYAGKEVRGDGLEGGEGHDNGGMK